MSTSEAGKAVDPLVGRRKYIVWWAVFLASCGFLAWGKLSADNFVELQWLSLGLYMAGNVGEHFARKP